MVIRDCAREAGNARGAGPGIERLLNRYLQWAENSEPQLTNVLGSQAVELLHTPRHWEIRRTAVTSPRFAALINAELDARQSQLNLFGDYLEDFRRRWRTSGTLVVADTNLYLHAPQTFDFINWRGLVPGASDVQLVVPLVVVDELDRLKRSANKPETRRRALDSLRRLDKLFSDDVLVAKPLPSTDQQQPATIRLLHEPPRHQRLATTDAEIAERARYLADVSGSRVVVATSDRGMRLRVLSLGREATFQPHRDEAAVEAPKL